uniref:Zinc finger protein 112 n=1 Tax=Cacopsylla melanoneura TaxID=428564 RepID=A0A8D8YD46_9HEMI
MPIENYLHFTPHFMSTILDQASVRAPTPDVKEFGCSSCDKKFKKREYLRAHIKHVHKAACRPFKCQKCPKTYKRKVHLDAHLLTHTDERPFGCEYCEKNFKTKDALAIHQKHLHHGIKPKKKFSFKCDLCPKAYTCRERLEAHHFSHTHIKKFICDLCSIHLSSMAVLKAHIKRVHQSDPEPKTKVQCHVCGSEYLNKVSLSRHIRCIHGDGKPKCHICGKVVSNKQVLKDHINYHTGEKPYACEYCSKKFASKSVLKTHVRQHTGETPFKCSICPKAFKQRSALTGHLKSNHAV